MLTIKPWRVVIHQHYLLSQHDISLGICFLYLEIKLEARLAFFWQKNIHRNHGECNVLHSTVPDCSCTVKTLHFRIHYPSMITLKCCTCTRYNKWPLILHQWTNEIFCKCHSSYTYWSKKLGDGTANVSLSDMSKQDDRRGSYLLQTHKNSYLTHAHLLQQFAHWNNYLDTPKAKHNKSAAR